MTIFDRRLQRIWRAGTLALLAFATIAIVSLTATRSGATFTHPASNPSNQMATATLAAPTGVSWSLLSNGTTVRLSWTATTSSWASGHRVYRGTASGGPYSQIQQISGLATTTYDDAVGAGTFYYVVRSYYGLNGANWESGNSNQVTTKSLDHFVFATVGTQHSGTAFNVTITAQASDNSTANYIGTVALTVNGGTISPTTSGAFTAGTRTESVTITGPYSAGETITATGGTPSKTGTSNAFTLNHFRATAVALNNHTGGVAGKAETSDTIVLTFSEAANTASLGSCGAGTSTSGSDILWNNTNPDTVSANGVKLIFGTIGLGNNGYFTASDLAKNSTCAWTGGNTVLTVTMLNTGTGVGTVAGSSTATYTPASALTSAAGESIDTAQTPSVTAVLF